MIDLHCHWLPERLVAALRARAAPPRIAERDGRDWLHIYREKLPFGADFVDLDRRLAAMDRAGVARQVLSLPGLFAVDSLPAAEAGPLVRLFNAEASALARQAPDRFAALAALPLDDPQAAAADLTEAVGALGMAGAILPADGFVSLAASQALVPILQAADDVGCHLFIHPGPLPAHAGAEVAEPAPAPPRDNAGARHITLDVQARLSAVMVTLLMTDLLDRYPKVTVQVANLGGNIAFMLDRLEHVAERRGERAPQPRRFAGRLVVDCASFAKRSIALAIEAFGAEAVVVGSDWPIFSADRVGAAIAALGLSPQAERQVRTGNAERLLGA
jgi:predicted TIM-barrel fold metal-dependent hydrolase